VLGSREILFASFTTPVAAIRLTMNALSSAGGKVTATILQAGIGDEPVIAAMFALPRNSRHRRRGRSGQILPSEEPVLVCCGSKAG